MATPQPNYLIAEDSDLQYAIAELMKAHLKNWGTNKHDWIVEIKRADGVDDALNHETLFEYMKAGGLKVLGVVVDADDKLEERWRGIREFCNKCNAQAPQSCPVGGFIVNQIVGPGGIVAKFGAWIMPDNRHEGMIENFCFDLVPVGNNELLEHAASSVGKAKYLGAPFTPSLNTNAKARLHTWLAWQEPPGQSIGRAIANRTLQPTAQSAQAFVAWFRQLYGV